MKEIIFDLLSVGKPAKAFSLNPEVGRAHVDRFRTLTRFPPDGLQKGAVQIFLLPSVTCMSL